MSNLNKMPVTILQEHSVAKKLGAPFYEELPEQTLDDLTKIFRSRVSAFGMSAEGCGLNKKNAKHAAAANLLKILNIPVNYVSDIEDDKSNFVKTLLDMCVSRNWPLAQFTEIQTSGPSHCPEFTIRCTLSSLTREAKAPKKKDAKQKVAQLMLQVIQEMNKNDPDKLKLMEMKNIIDEDMDCEEKVIKSYRDYKNSDVKKQLGVPLIDRHNFFITNFDAERIEEAKSYLVADNLSIQNRVDEMLHALKLKYKVEPFPSNDKQMMAFELEHDNYDCFFVAFEDVFWTELHKYFEVMLG